MGAEKASDSGADADGSYCAATGVADGSAGAGSGESAGPPFADCVYCGKPTEYAAARRGVTLCPVCEWQEAQRGACSG